jgi:hypothetical protein
MSRSLGTDASIVRKNFHGLSGSGGERLAQPRPRVDDALLQYLSPLGWEHINLTGDYLWRMRTLGSGKFRLLRHIHRLKSGSN